MHRVPGPQEEPGDVGPQGPPCNTSGGLGAVYVRWGRTTCPTGRELVYSGRAARNHYTHTGGGINYQCFPDDPEYDAYGTGGNGAYVYGVELYQELEPLNSSTIYDHNVPCAVCYVPTCATSLMIPAKLTCPTGWTEEYHGYLMSEYHHHASPSTFECIDSNAETIPGSTSADDNGGLFYHVLAQCNGLACPPYDDTKELTCVVCTK